ASPFVGTLGVRPAVGRPVSPLPAGDVANTMAGDGVNTGSKPYHGRGWPARGRAGSLRADGRERQPPGGCAVMHPGPGPHMMRAFAGDPPMTKQRVRRGTVARIARYARPYRWDLAIFLFAAALDAVITVTIPVLLGVVIDRGVLPKRADVVLWIAAAAAGLA